MSVQNSRAIGQSICKTASIPLIVQDAGNGLTWNMNYYGLHRPHVSTLCIPYITAYDQISQAFQICILQEIRDWRQHRTGNKTSLQQHYFVTAYVCTTDQSKIKACLHTQCLHWNYEGMVGVRLPQIPSRAVCFNKMYQYAIVQLRRDITGRSVCPPECQLISALLPSRFPNSHADNYNTNSVVLQHCYRARCKGGH